MTTNRPRTPVDDLIDAALARQRAALADQLHARLTDTPGDDTLATGIRIGLVVAEQLVRDGRSRPSEAG